MSVKSLTDLCRYSVYSLLCLVCYLLRLVAQLSGNRTDLISDGINSFVDRGRYAASLGRGLVDAFASLVDAFTCLCSNIIDSIADLSGNLIQLIAALCRCFVQLVASITCQSGHCIDSITQLVISCINSLSRLLIHLVLSVLNSITRCCLARFLCCLGLSSTQRVALAFQLVFIVSWVLGVVQNFLVEGCGIFVRE
uniref:Uncharacterized protein n=1 Tax=Cacopsylla melanoneura TaxID=428564 RepID=A0A8D9BD58_9HEMI